MLIAAYIVAGFVVASVYAVGMMRGRRDRYHRVGFLIPFTVAAIAMPLQIFFGDVVAREVFHNEPAKFAAIEALPTTGDHVRREPRRCRRRRQAALRHPDPGRRVDPVRLPAVDPDRRAGRHPGGRAPARPAGEHRAPVLRRHGRHRVPAARAGALVRDWPGGGGATCRAAGGSCGRRALSGVVAVVSLESGWVVTEVGRQPWTVVGLLLTRDAVATSGNLWPFFAGALVIYAGVTVGAVLVLRAMHRSWRAGDEVDVPYGPGPGGASGARREHVRRRAAVRRRGHVRGVRRRRLRRRVLGPHRRRGRARPAAAASDRPVDRAGVGGQPRLADLLPGRDVDGVPEGVRGDHDHAVPPARPGRARHRAARLRLRVPQGGRCARPSSG